MMGHHWDSDRGGRDAWVAWLAGLLPSWALVRGLWLAKRRAWDA